jgi:predicted short-subunit dehydrogenase-like oxidoreductase (DUF2520 family)
MSVISVIGAGRVGTSLARYFKKREREIGGFFSRSHESAARAVGLCGGRVYPSPAALAVESDILIIAVPDDEIEGAAFRLEHSGASFTGKTVFHTSGALTSEVLLPLNKKGAAVFSVHPPMTFSDVYAPRELLDDLTFVAEGRGNPARVEALFNRVRFIDPLDKPLYHVAACIAGNYLAALMDEYQKLLELLQIPAGLFDAMLLQTMRNVRQKGAREALTGPIARGDAKTVELHLREISDGQLRLFYKTLGRMTAQLALDGGKISKEAYEKLQNILQ